MRNYQKYGFDTIQTKNFIAFCNIYDNRTGFVHECRIEWDGVTYYAKNQYYNRTWESYEFESVIHKAIEKMPKILREQAREEFRAWAAGESEKLDAKFEAFKKNFESLTAGQKKSLESVTVETPQQFDSVCSVVGMMAALNALK